MIKKRRNQKEIHTPNTEVGLKPNKKERKKERNEMKLSKR